MSGNATTKTSSRRRWPAAWRAHGKNPLPWLKEHWYQVYVCDHAQKLGLANLEGPFESGCDFRAVVDGRSVTVEVERDYISFIEHAHPRFDILIVGVLDDPLPDMRPLLPAIIKNLDPHEVATHTKPKRTAYWQAKEEERRRLPSVEDLIRAGHRVRGYGASASSLAEDLRSPVNLMRVKEGWAAIEDAKPCLSCGGVLVDEPFDMDLLADMSEGQAADYESGLVNVYACQSCGVREWLNPQ